MKAPAAMLALSAAAIGAGVYFATRSTLPNGETPEPIPDSAAGRSAMAQVLAVLKQEGIDPRLPLPKAPTVGISSWSSLYGELGQGPWIPGADDVVPMPYRWFGHIYGVANFGPDVWAGQLSGLDAAVGARALPAVQGPRAAIRKAKSKARARALMGRLTGAR